VPLPDLIEIVPLTAPVRAEITVPGSKSITNRALVLAALADGEVTLQGALWSEDTQVMVECLQELGYMVNVARDPDEACNRTITVYGLGGRVPRGGTVEQPLELFVGNAGTVARFLAAMVCLGDGVYRLHGVPRMHERPQAALFQALRELGYRVEAEQGNDKLPAKIYGGAKPERGTASRSAVDDQQAVKEFERGVAGEAAAGHRPALRSCTVSIEDSSQFASALLLCEKTGGWQIDITGENAEESPYVAMTSEMVKVFPQGGGKFQIEPDASSGSYFWAISMFDFLATWKPRFPLVRIEDQEPIESRLLYEMDWFKVRVANWPLTRWQVDALFPMWQMSTVVSREMSLGDSIMTAMIVAPFGSCETRFTDLKRLRLQECERVAAMRTELSKCGAQVVEEGDTLTIATNNNVLPKLSLGFLKRPDLHGAEIETYHDHRMAMCFAILGLKVPGIKIKNPACVKKTFPNFFQKLAAPPPHGLGASILDGHTGRKLGVEELFAD